VFDLMEPLRPRADRAVLDLVANRAFAPGDVAVADSGVCRLNPGLTKALTSAASFDGFATDVARRAAEVIGPAARMGHSSRLGGSRD
jgi:hypothetical protein